MTAERTWLRQLLQRGLGIAAEDRAEAGLPSPPVGVASTGPRHRCRGSACTIWIPSATFSQLQRGLGIAAEDRRAVHASVAHGSALQRGLGIAAEDRAVGPHRRELAGRASTGPRHRCRGSSEGRSPTGSRPACFNGASASLPRIGLGRLDHRGERRASTGPRHRCRGSDPEQRLDAPEQVASTGPRHRCRGSGSPGTLVISETYNSSCEQLLGTRQPGIRGRFEPDGHPARTFMLSRTWAIASAHRGLRGARPLAATNVAPESRPRRRTAQAPCMHAREKRWSCLPFLPPARRPRRALGPGRGG